MIHLGDITKISGYEVPIVDCVIGGSPCQDLSIAGKRAGLAGERSGLYIEQIRLIKEMREQDVRRNNGRADRPVRPRYMVWENVPGAFSSNKGKDFAAVLEEAIRIAEPEVPDVLVPEKGWPTAGTIVGDGWSIAWRTHDAQYWGVPQRRKRISLVADFGGRTAPEILFECKSVSRNTEPSSEERERPSTGTQGSTSYAVRIRGGCDGGGKGALVQEEKSGTLGTGNDQTVFCIQGNCIDRADTAGCNGKGWRTDQSYTLNTIDRPAVVEDIHIFGKGTRPHNKAEPQKWHKAEIANTLNSFDCGETRCNELVTCKTVRRLTPLECERLQGFPDNWTNIGEWIDSKGKKHDSSDSARYKALGNSIALPFWRFLCKRISAQYARKATMASLFDGIGGFPLVWEEANGKGSAIWASEIEEFPMAVTKYHFGDE